MRGVCGVTAPGAVADAVTGAVKTVAEQLVRRP
jgi:hypothetical protein